MRELSSRIEFLGKFRVPGLDRVFEALKAGFDGDQAADEINKLVQFADIDPDRG